jgi:hypothetical protein
MNEKVLDIILEHLLEIKKNQEEQKKDIKEIKENIRFIRQIL